MSMKLQLNVEIKRRGKNCGYVRKTNCRMIGSPDFEWCDNIANYLDAVKSKPFLTIKEVK